METKDVQTLLAAAGYFKGAINGTWGDDTYAAAKLVYDKHTDLLVGDQPFPRNRVIVAAAQMILHFAGHSPGGIDGYAGHNTNEAFNDWAAVKETGKPREIDRTPIEPYTPVKGSFPTQAQCAAFYGTPGLPGSAAEKAMSAKLVYIEFPISMRVDFDLSQSTKKTRFHQKCAASAQSAYEEAVKAYGEKRFRELGLDRFAGAYMPRLMRGSTKTFSMHAYGCTHDTYAAPNGLNVHKPKALFSGSDYVQWFNIWEGHGWTSLGRAIDRDYMHIQAASLK